MSIVLDIDLGLNMHYLISRAIPFDNVYQEGSKQ